MNSFLFDASALVKRFTPEPGAVLVDHLYSQVGITRFRILMLGAAEVVATLVRKRNAGKISAPSFASSMTQFELEVIQPPQFTKMSTENRLIEAALGLLSRHSINATDAIVLRASLDLAAMLRSVGDNLVLVAADRRLLRAAGGEGLVTFNPETQSQSDLDALI
jgi:predicted nucleic acid-binding protein